MKVIDREEFKTDLRTDVDAYGKPKRLMTKIGVLFDSYEALQAENEALEKKVFHCHTLITSMNKKYPTKRELEKCNCEICNKYEAKE